MSWKPWQAWLALAWLAVALILVALYFVGWVPVGVIWAITIVGGVVGVVRVVMDRRARHRILNQIVN